MTCCGRATDRWYTLGNVIAIVDALLETQLSPKASICWPAKPPARAWCDEPLPAGRPGQAGRGNTGAFEPCAGSLPLRPPLCCGHRCAVQALGRPDRRRYAAAGQLRPLSSQLRRCILTSTRRSRRCISWSCTLLPQLQDAARALFADPPPGHICASRAFCRPLMAGAN